MLFLFKNKKIVHFRTDFKQILSSKPHNFSSVGEKRVSQSDDREKHIFFPRTVELIDPCIGCNTDAQVMRHLI